MFDTGKYTVFETSSTSLRSKLFTIFCLQGVHLGTIVKNMHLSEDKQKIMHDIIVALEKIKCAADGSPSESDLPEPLATFSAECKVSVAHRVLANKNNAYEVLIKLIKKVQV